MTTFYLDPEGGDDLGSDFSIYGRVPAHNNISSVAFGKYGGRSISTAAGTSSYMSFANQTANGMQMQNFRFTAEAWVYFTSHSSSTIEPIMGQWNNVSSNNLVWQIGMNASGQLQYTWSTSGSAAAGTLVYSWTPTLNQWYHIAFDRDGTTARLYIDGVVVASVADALPNLYSTTTNFFVGGDNSGARNFPGYIQDARLTKYVARYAGAFTPPAGALPIGYANDPYWHHVYLLVPGRMDGTGTSFANRWRTVETGATAARTAAGDTIRMMATPDPTLVGNATWTQNSATVTLASAVTQNIHTCNSNWTGATNVTATLQTGSTRREGTGYVSLAVASAFTTGKIAYGSTLQGGGNSIANRSANMLGVGSLTAVVSAYADDANVSIALPFNVNFNGTNYSTVYVGSNSYLTFGTGSSNFSSLGPTNPAIPGIHINAADHAYIKVYAGSEDSNATYRIRYEGRNDHTNSTADMFWEVTFTAATPGVIKIDMGSNAASGTGTSGITDGTSASYLATFGSGTANTGYTLTYSTGSALDLSAYQQVSFWFQSNASLNSANVRLCLCSDTTGDTVVQSFYLPDFYSTTSRWMPMVFDTGAALPSSVQSVALYADVDPGTATFLLDNIIACKASSSADSLTHRSLIGKVHNLPWAASTAYSLNDRRRPTQTNRNGFQYKVTTAGTSGSSEPTWPAAWGKTVTDGSVVWTCVANELEDSWFAITGINGTTLTLDNSLSDSFTSLRGYHGATETVSTYKREPKNFWPIPTNFTSTNNVRKAGSTGLPITYSGGWDRSAMSTLNGETWWDGVVGNGMGLVLSTFKFVNVDHFNGVRFQSVLYGINGGGTISHCHANNCTTGVDFGGGQQATFNGMHSFNCSSFGVSCGNASTMYGKAVQGHSSGASVGGLGVILGKYKTRISYVVARNNATTGIGAYSTNIYDSIVYNYATSGNGAFSVSCGASDMNSLCFVNGSTSETNYVNQSSGMGSGLADAMLFSHKHGGDVNDHRIFFAEGTIRSDTSTRHTASGLAWKCSLTSTARTVIYPVRFSLGRYLLQANVSKTFKVWARRDNANIKGQLLIYGGSLPGIDADATVSTDPSSLNTWEQSAGLTVTPTETGVVELWMLWWDGVGTTNNYWIDDLTVT